jgi:hypothetical protein
VAGAWWCCVARHWRRAGLSFAGIAWCCRAGSAFQGRHGTLGRLAQSSSPAGCQACIHACLYPPKAPAPNPQIHFGPLFPEPHPSAKRPDAPRDAAAAPGAYPSGPLGRPSVGRKDRVTGEGGAAAGPGAGDCPPPGYPLRDFCDQPSLARRSVSRWAGAAAASLVTFGHSPISEIRSLLSHALPSGPGALAGTACAAVPAAGPAPMLEAARSGASGRRSGGTSCAGSGACGKGSPHAQGSPAASPPRQLSPSCSGRARAAAALPNLDTLQVGGWVGVLKPGRPFAGRRRLSGLIMLSPTAVQTYHLGAPPMTPAYPTMHLPGGRAHGLPRQRRRRSSRRGRCAAAAAWLAELAAAQLLTAGAAGRRRRRRGPWQSGCCRAPAGQSKAGGRAGCRAGPWRGKLWRQRCRPRGLGRWRG